MAHCAQKWARPQTGILVYKVRRTICQPRHSFQTDHSPCVNSLKFWNQFYHRKCRFAFEVGFVENPDLKSRNHRKNNISGHPSHLPSQNQNEWLIDCADHEHLVKPSRKWFQQDGHAEVHQHKHHGNFISFEGKSVQLLAYNSQWVQQQPTLLWQNFALNPDHTCQHWLHKWRICSNGQSVTDCEEQIFHGVPADKEITRVLESNRVQADW